MLCKTLIIFFSVLSFAVSRHHHFYRKDYTFFEEFDAYYKIHWDLHGISWDAAFLACDDEEAKLFYPKQEGEWAVAKNLSDALLKKPNVTDIFIGIHDEFALGQYITVDGKVTPNPLRVDAENEIDQNCVLMDIETGTYKVEACLTEPDTIRPFICKKVDEKRCPTIDLGYSYVDQVKKCYKVNNKTRTWQDAMYTCFMEGAMLVVIDNDAESRTVSGIIEGPRNYKETIYFAGFKKMIVNGNFYTVNGKNLQDSGFPEWRNDHRDQECGAIRRYSDSLDILTTNCNLNLPFVCEMEPIR